MENIFISYKRKTKDKVFSIIRYIEENIDETCWVDFDGIMSNTNFASKICKAIDNSQVVLFMHSSLHSGKTIDNDWTIKELFYAVKKNKKIIVVRLDDAPLDELLVNDFLKDVRIEVVDYTNLSFLKLLLKKIFNKAQTSNGNEDNQITILEEGISNYSNGNYLESIKYFLKASELGIARADYYLGKCYLFGDGFAKDERKAIEYFERAEKQDDSEAILFLGTCYLNGLGIDKDYKKAVNLFNRAIELGNIIALGNLAYCYNEGCGVQQDSSKAFQLYLRAAEAGCSMAYKSVALAYRFGDGVKQNSKESFRWYLKAAECGDETAIFVVGYFYENGIGVDINYKEALYWYKKAAILGDDDALEHINKLSPDNLFEQGRSHLKYNNYTDAFEKFSHAANEMHVDSIYYLGYCYYNGLGVEQSYYQAFELFLKASKCGSVKAMFELGLCYYNGIGTNVDLEEAFKWFMNSINEGDNIISMHLIGDCYYYGNGVKKDLDKAKYWYEMAADKGYINSRISLFEKFRIFDRVLDDRLSG